MKGKINMRKEELLKKLDEEKLDKVREVAEGFEHSFIAVGKTTDDGNRVETNIIGSCSPAFLAEVIDAVLSENPQVLAELAIKKMFKLSKMIGLENLDENSVMSVDDLMQNLESLHKSQEVKKTIH